MRMRLSLFCSIAGFLNLLFASPPAYAIAVPTPVTAAASAVGYKICIAAAEEDGKLSFWEKAGCALILADPPAADITSVDISFSVDPDKFEILPIPLFFGDFSESGAFLPVTTGTTGAAVPLEPEPAFDPDLARLPRTGSTYSFEVDNVNGTAHLSMDLTGNPIPGDAVAQNFFGFAIATKSGQDILSVEYFDSPGTYDLIQTSLTCTRAAPPHACGSDTPIYGANFIIPEPTTLLLLAFGLATLAAGRRRRLV